MKLQLQLSLPLFFLACSLPLLTIPDSDDDIETVLFLETLDSKLGLGVRQSLNQAIQTIKTHHLATAAIQKKLSG